MGAGGELMYVCGGLCVCSLVGDVVRQLCVCKRCVFVYGVIWVFGGFMCEGAIRECVVERVCGWELWLNVGGCWQAWAETFKIKDTHGQELEPWKAQLIRGW